jgi:hypothetical protein
MVPPSQAVLVTGLLRLVTIFFLKKEAEPTFETVCHLYKSQPVSHKHSERLKVLSVVLINNMVFGYVKP